jgi:hypothetical protein
MKRLLIAAALFGSFALPIGPAARGDDVIRYFNRKTQKNEEVRGTVTEETPAKVTYKPSGSDRAVEVPAADISEIDYQIKDNDKFGRLEWNRPLSALRRARSATRPAERKKDLENALDGYRALAPLVSDNKMWARHVHFGAAEVLVMLAESDPARADAAIDALRKFKAGYGDGWQLVKATKMLVRLLEQKGDEAGAQAAYVELADNAAVPKEVRQEFDLLVIRYLLRKGKAAEAAGRARALQGGVAPNDPQALKLKVYLAACDIAAGKLDGAESQLKGVLDSGAGNDVKALARNTLGDYYRARGEGDKAFWEYLWVDIQYNQDREELARALYHLSKLFAEVRKDPVRARECLDRLCDEKLFGGLEYHRKALAEKSAGSGG